jgi:hypothetical protein
MMDLQTDDLVATAVRALADWHRADFTRCSRHGLLRGGMAPSCPECKRIDEHAGACFRRVQDVAGLLAQVDVV